MRVEKVVAVLALWVGLLTGVASALGAESDAAAANLDKLQEQFRVLDKDVSVLKEVSVSKLDAQDKRISDIGLAAAQQGNHLSAISNQTGIVGSQIAWTSVGVTVLVFVGGLFAFWSVTARAEREARAASTEWFKENSIELRKEIDQLREQAAQAVEGISQHHAGVAASADAANKSIAKHANSILTQKPIDGDNTHRVDSAAEQAVNRVSDELKEKPEADFTAENHFARGLSQFAKGNHLSALDSFRAASRKLPETAPADALARYLFAQGATLGILGKAEEEIAIYDELFSRFGKDETQGAREQVAKGLVNKGATLGQLGKSIEAISSFDELFSHFGKDETPGVREQVARGLINKGVTIALLGKTEEAIAIYDELFCRFGNDESPGVREQVAGGLINKGVTLGLLGKPEEEIAIYEELFRRFGKDDSPVLRELVAGGLVNKGATLGKLGKPEEAIAIFDELCGRFGRDESPGVREKVVAGLVNKGVTLGKLGKPGESIAIYDEVYSRFGKDEWPGVREQVAKALFSKGTTLGQMSKPNEAVFIYDELFNRFVKDETPGVREQVAKGLVNKGVTLGRLGKSEEELAVYDEIERHFGKNESSAVTEQVAVARNGAAFKRILSAKQNWQDANRKTALLAAAVKELNAALQTCADDARAMVSGNLGYALSLRGDHAAAMEPTRDCLKLGGETALAAQREDAKLNRVEPEDGDYEALITRLWAELHPSSGVSSAGTSAGS